MSIKTRIDEAVARHQVVYGSMPEKAVVPAKDFDDLFPPSFRQEGMQFVTVPSNGDLVRLAVSSGKVTDVMLFRKRAE